MTTTVGVSTNPYVGPRAFRPGEALHGRDREVLELLDLLLAERIVLLHSPSGAGKTSLVQAALVNRLQEEGFEVLPVVRVNIEPPFVAASVPGHNRYALSVLMSLQQNVPLDDQLDGRELAGTSLDRYLSERPSTADNQVLIFDQFEEVLLDPADQTAKREFFAQLAEALRTRERWALFLVRDDFVAALDQYLRALPTRVRTRFRLDFLSQQAARQAVQRPAERMGIPFSEHAVDKLIDDLRQVWVQQPDGSSVPKPGPFVEPVQLQVVCLRLWERLGPGRTEIEESDIESAGDVDTALSTYYAQQVAEVTARTGTSERAIRDWFDLQLIVEQRFRGQARQGPDDGRGDGRAVLWLLEDAHLIRADQRLGTTWYELAHDRLVTPVQGDNARWRQSHLHALQRQAVIWNDEGRPEGLLFGPRELAEAESWAAQHPGELTRLDRTFLDAGRHQGARERRRRLVRRALVAVTIVAVLFGGIAAFQTRRADRQAKVSAASALMAEALADLEVDPQRSVQDALDALGTSPDAMTPEIRDVLYRAVDTSRLRATLRDPAAPGVGLADLALSPDGSGLATAGLDGQVRIWDLQARQVRRTLDTADSLLVASVAFGRGDRVAAGKDKGATIWDAASGELTTVVDHGDYVSEVALDPVAGRLATVGTDGTAKVWSADTGALLHTLPLEARDGVTVAFDADGRRLATGAGDGTVTIWDATTGQRIRDVRGHTGGVQAVAFTPDGRSLISASRDATARIWSVDTGQTLVTLFGHTNSVFWAGFTPDAERVATTSADGTARIWDATSGRLLLTLEGHTNPIQGAAFGPSGATLFTSSWDGLVKVWDASTTHSGIVPGLAFQPGGSRMLATGGEDHLAKLWDIGPADPACAGGPAATLNAGAGPRLTLRGHTDMVSAVAFSPDGTLLATASGDATVKLWDVASGRPVTTLTGYDDDANGLAWSPHGDMLASAWTGGMIVWEVPSGRSVQRIDLPQVQVNSVSFGPDGTTLAAAESSGYVEFWDVASGSYLNYAVPHTTHIFKAVYSPRAGSNLLATASVDKTAKLVDATTMQTIAEFRHDNVVSDVAFSPDATRLATASWDRTVRIWNVDTRAPVVTITHAAQVVSVTFSPDGRLLATTTSDNVVHVYDLDDQHLLALARCRAAAG